MFPVLKQKMLIFQNILIQEQNLRSTEETTESNCVFD